MAGSNRTHRRTGYPRDATNRGGASGLLSAIVFDGCEPTLGAPARVAGKEVVAMIARGLSLMLLVAPGYCWGQSLDKTGTSGSRSAVSEAKTLEKKEPASAGSFTAERAGFEPAEGFYPLAALAKRCFRPLSHLSGWWNPFLLLPLRHFGPRRLS